MILVDAGPMVAVLRSDDRHHSRCVEALASLRAPLGTVWPAISEAMHLLRSWRDGPDRLWQRLERGALRIYTLDGHDCSRMRELMRKYRDLPMDLADAALVRVAEREGIDTVFTVDRRDFEVYRLLGRRRFKIIP